ncbi:hypothetical protein NEOLEDRAFT_1150623 [Neolentinus lepideus HHB14362 ss-1]|uniref:Uncharacterized protein n=1 Tax=Neolentinus lepideus HHB14362 ss-1 TaxID=1314782 RepID=A0A165PWW1_9AGAM|nr:hypothetical protein NEOLEDRAFT_1150623 [Neolentinus lepideus HHB14362 ss-1]
MGRPLFSGVYRNSTPVVRVEPEPVYPTYGKWSQWNAFDPDSDEFFESDDAVYEAFVDPADLPPREEGSTSSRSPSPALIVPGHQAADVVITEDGASDVSSGSSEGTASGRESPMEAANQEDEGSEAGARTGDYAPLVVRVPINQDAPRPVGGLSHMRALYDNPEAGHTYQPGDVASHYANMYNIALRNRDRSESSSAIARTPTTRTSDITPIFVRVPHDTSARVPVTPATPPRRSGSPTAHRTPSNFMTPSPPPTVTPRLYHWSPRPVSTPASPSPAPLLTNPSARMSLAHIAPTPVEARHIRI